MWWMIFCHRPFEPSNQRLYSISSKMEVTGCDSSTELKRRVLHASRRCLLFLGTWSHSHIGSSLLFIWWRFLFVCFCSCFILISYASVSDFLNYRFCAVDRDMVIIHICHFYHCSCVSAGGQIVPEGTCRAVFCLNG